MHYVREIILINKLYHMLSKFDKDALQITVNIIVLANILNRNVMLYIFCVPGNGNHINMFLFSNPFFFLHHIMILESCSNQSHILYIYTVLLFIINLN